MPGRPIIWMIVGQGPIVLAVGAGGGCLDIFALLYPFSPLSPSLSELKGPLKPKQQRQQQQLFRCNYHINPIKRPESVAFNGKGVCVLCVWRGGGGSLEPKM